MIAQPPRLDPMFAEGGWRAFDDPGWWFEPKPDGIRCLAELPGGRDPAAHAHGRDATEQYLELHMVHELVDQVNAVIDGEIVAFDDAGRPSFEVLQQRMKPLGQREIARAAKTIPVSLVVFDLLKLDGHETTGLTLEQRRELELIVEQDHRLQVTAHVDGDGLGFTQRARRARPRGRRREVGDRPVRPPAQPGLAEDQADEHPGVCVILGWTPARAAARTRPANRSWGRSTAASCVGSVRLTGAHRSHARRPDGPPPLVRPDPPIDDPTSPG